MQIFENIGLSFKLPSRNYELWLLILMILICIIATGIVILLQESLLVLFFSFLILILSVIGILVIRLRALRLLRYVSKKKGEIIIHLIKLRHSMRPFRGNSLSTDRRSHVRCSSNNMPQITWSRVRNPLSFWHPGRTFNISYGGCFFNCRQRLVEGDRLVILFCTDKMSYFECCFLSEVMHNHSDRNNQQGYGTKFIFSP